VGQVTIRASTFEGNQAAGDGGAIQASTTLGTPAQSVVVRRSWFAGNTSAGGSGGAYHGGDDNNRSLHLLAENRFVDNQAPVGLGGAVFVENDGHVGYYGLHRTKVGVRDNTFVANEAAGGAHLYLTSRVTHAVANNVFAAAGSGSFAVVLHTAPGVVDYNLWFDNAGGDLSGVPLGSHDVFANPLFVAWTDDGDPSNDDLHLQPGSPAVDAGHPSLLDPDLSPSDIGYTAAGLP
jgi:predicted outer membrane repeat protein